MESARAVAKTASDVKCSRAVGKPQSPRDSHPDDLDTVLVVSSEDIAKARAAAESLTSETATVDRHPVIVDDAEEDTDRFTGNDASSSGLVKNPLKVKAKRAPDPEPELETSTNVVLPKVPLSTLLAEDEEIIEISDSGVVPEAEQTPAREPAATIAEVREVEAISEDTETQERPKAKNLRRFDDETKPMPKGDLADVAGAMETVPLDAALVQNVLAQVDARAAARAAGRTVPHFEPPPAPAQPLAQPLMQPPQPYYAPHAHAPAPPAEPGRRIGVEILITLAAFLLVAVPALYYLYVSFSR